MNGVWQVHTFKYPEVVHNHYRYQDMVNNHNSLRMHPLSVEETWMTACWPHRVFCFLLAMTVVNIQNGGAYFRTIPKLDALSTRRNIAREFIYNRYLIVEQSPSRKCPHHSAAEHCLITLPTHKNFLNGKLVTCKSKDQTWPCSCKAAGVRTYCACSPGELLCPECYATHQADKRQWLFLLIHLKKFPFLANFIMI